MQPQGHGGNASACVSKKSALHMGWHVTIVRKTTRSKVDKIAEHQSAILNTLCELTVQHNDESASLDQTRAHYVSC